MSSDGEVTARACAAVIAASGVVASSRTVTPKGAPLPGLWPPNAGRRLEIPTRADIPRLLAGTRQGHHANAEHRIARATVGSLLYACKTPPAELRRLLAPREQNAFDGVVASAENSVRTRQPAPADYVHCRYCALLSAALYRDRPPPVLVVGHSAHVITTFDPETNIAEASITGYRMLMPKALAIEMIAMAHPRRWRQAAPQMFRKAEAAVRNAQSKWQPDEKYPTKDWDQKATSSAAFLWEEATWPWNELIQAEITNVIRIDNFKQRKPDRDTRPGSAGDGAELSLEYHYSLESCLGSFLGITWERGGLDIDAGQYRGKAYDVNKIANDAPYENITVGDLRHLGIRSSDPSLSVDDPVAPATAQRALQLVAKEKLDGQEVWLTEVTASKRLRYTAPGDTPVELWGALTSMAPALLFSFLNRAVCQAVHQVALGLGHQDA